MLRNILFVCAVISLLLIAVNVNGQVQTNDYDFWFNLNTDGITTGYELFVWSGADTSGIDILDMAKVWEGLHQNLSQQFPSGRVHLTDVYPSPLNGQYIKIAGLAYNLKADQSRNYSFAGYSPALLKDLTAPNKPGGCFISE
jgi:hypothetical protein